MSKELSIPDFMGTPAGRFLREWESSQVVGVVGDVFGYSAVQIGLPELDLLRGNRIATHIQILPPRIAEPEKLFQSGSSEQNTG